MDPSRHRPLKATLLTFVLVVTACIGPDSAVAARSSADDPARPGYIADDPARLGYIARHPSAAQVPSTPPSVRTSTPWLWPLGSPGQISNGFRAPATRYSAGHRGIDLPAPRSAPVYAPSDGVVSFAGAVAGRPVLAVTHAGDLITSFEPVLANVSTGDRVARGDMIGAVAAGGHCGDSCLHFGVRLHGEYVSPLLYLAGVPRAVLLPLLDMRGKS